MKFIVHLLKVMIILLITKSFVFHPGVPLATGQTKVEVDGGREVGVAADAFDGMIMTIVMVWYDILIMGCRRCLRGMIMTIVMVCYDNSIIGCRKCLRGCPGSRRRSRRQSGS